MTDRLKKYLAARQRICRFLGTVTIGLFLLTGIKPVSAQSLEDFGYGKKVATGGRPLLIILTEFEGSPQLRQNSSSAAAYFDALVFGSPVGIVNDVSLSGYFYEISNGRFTWTRAGVGVVGPYHFKPEDFGVDAKGLTRLTLALRAAAADGFNFADFDTNGDFIVSTDELGIIVIDNYDVKGKGLLSGGASNRASHPDCFGLVNPEITLCLRGAMLGHYASFMNFAHELSHSLGTYDLYGESGNSFGYTLMGPTPEDGFETFHLDPFHKMLFGWVEPKIRSIVVPGTEIIGAAQLLDGDEPVILYNPYDLHEYFMLEYRTRGVAGDSGYDADVPANGLVIWQIRLNDYKQPVGIPSLADMSALDLAVFTLGAPNMTRGMGTAWPTADGFILKDYNFTPSLKWLSGDDTGVRFKVGKTTDNRSKLNVAWGDFPEEPLPPREKIIFYSETWRLGDIGEFNEYGNYNTLATFNSGYVGYTHVVEDPAGTLYYDRRTGAAMLATIDSAGNQTIVKNFTLGAGWTHIVSHRGYLFFYYAPNGMAAIGTLSANGFRQYTSYPANSFGKGWTHIVSTGSALLFYAQGNGMAAVGDWEFIYDQCGFCFPTVSEVRFKTLSWFPAGSFRTGWTSIVTTSNGVSFYRQSDGLQVMVDVAGNGGVTTRMHTHQYINPGYTAVVAAGDDVLFYNGANGDIALAQVLKADPWVVSYAVGGLAVRQELQGYLTPGWEHLTATVPSGTIH